jgi:hypothetical protein
MAARSAATAISISERKPSKGGAVDGRTLVARRRRELIDVYASALGGHAVLSEGQLIDIRKAAELTALAEQARARAMRDGVGDTAELSAMIRLESTAARAVRAVNVPVVAGNAKPKSPTDHLSHKAAEKPASASAGAPA